MSTTIIPAAGSYPIISGAAEQIIDLAASDLECDWQAVCVHCPMDLARAPRSACPDGLFTTAAGSGTMLVCFRVGAVYEYPLEIGILDQRLEDPQSFPGNDLCIEALLDRVPDTEAAGQISPRTAYAHAVEHALNGQAQVGLVVDDLLVGNFSSFAQISSLSISRGIANSQDRRCSNLDSVGLLSLFLSTAQNVNRPCQTVTRLSRTTSSGTVHHGNTHGLEKTATVYQLCRCIPRLGMPAQTDEWQGFSRARRGPLLGGVGGWAMVEEVSNQGVAR